MADGVVLNAGAGGVTAVTDDCGAPGHAQVVKLAIATDGSATLIPADATNGLLTDVARCIPGVAATALGKAEDAAHTTGDTGVAVLGVRRDTAAVGSGTDGDYSTLNLDASGQLWVNASGAAVPVTDNAGSLTVDNATISVVGGGVEATAQRVTIASDSTGVLSVDDNGGTLTVDGTVTANLAAGTNNIGDVDVLTIAAGDNNIGNVDIVTMPNVTLAAGTNTNEVVGDAAHDAASAGNPILVGGYASATAPTDVSADADAVRAWHLRNGAQATVLTAAGALIGGDAANGLDVDITRLPASTNTLEVVGDVAHDAAAAGNPVLIAGRATNNIEGLTQVAAADSSFITTDLNGCIVTRPYTTLEETIQERIADTSGTSTAFTNFSAVASVRNFVTSITIWNSSATDGYVDIRDGAAGSVLATIPAPQTGGAHITFPVPLKSTANTALAYDVSGAITTVYITMVGFQAKG